MKLWLPLKSEVSHGLTNTRYGPVGPFQLLEENKPEAASAYADMQRIDGPPHAHSVSRFSMVSE